MEKKYITIGIVCVVVAAILLIVNSSDTSTTGNIIYENNQLKIPMSDISTKAEFYDYNIDGVDVEFFVVKAKDGSIKTAFNACDVCYRAKKGYTQVGDDMMCNNCGNYYAISGLGSENKKGGGCWPGDLESNVEDNYLIIKYSDIAVGRYRFA